MFMGRGVSRACSRLNILGFTFVVHFLIVGDVEAHVVVFEFRKAQLQPTDVLDFNYGREHA
jgi:hypothetical protein